MHISKTLLVLFVVWWSSLGCFALEPSPEQKPIPLENVSQRQHLLFAVQTSPQVFFSRLLNRRLRKAPVGNWEILHDDGVFIYYGYPIFKELLSDNRQIKTLYKVSRHGTYKTFPKFDCFMVERSESHNRKFLTTQLQPAFKEPLGWLSQIHYVFDKERPHVFEVSTNVNFKTVQCRYNLVFKLPESTIAKIEQLPIRQQRSKKCPQPLYKDTP